MTSRFSSPLVRPLLVISVLGTLGVIASSSGCGPGDESRYYCDSTGCFTCDAYGCSPQTSPAHPACTGNASCGAGGVCTATGCTTKCTADSACPKGETCQSGLCSAPGTAPGPTKECSSKTDCGAGQTCTAAGACAACGGTAGPCPCTAAADCSGGLACVGGSCTSTANVCKYSSECGDNKVCAEGQCLSSCESAPCGDAFTCEKGVCKPKPSGGGGGTTCTGDAQCTSPDAPNCVSGSCAKACTGDLQCGDGKYCNQGACAIDTRPKPNCTADDQCGGTAATPKKCLGGFCKYSCTTDQYCRTIDNRIGYCAKDGVCRTSSEAAATACTGPGTCPTGQSCIDNTCK